MNGMNDLPLDRIVEILAAKGREGEYWDYKQEWHENMADLLKDIICFANTPYDANCYLLFGIDDDGHIVGMKKNRRKQADILEAMDNLWFIGDVRPEISVETVVVNEIEVDVLTVYDTQKTPIYLKRNYGEMLAGCIYMRNGDKNTPNRGMASIDDVEKLWKKRFGLLQTPLEYIIGRLQYQTEWKQQDHIYYNMYRPEYQLKILKGDEDYLIPEFYAYTMSNKNTSYEMLQIIAGDTILEEYQIVVLDSGRYKTPVPEWGFAGYDRYRIDHKFTYKYFVKGSTEYRLQQFFLDGENEEAIYANRRLMEVVLLYETEDEKSAFEAYIEDNQEEIMERISKKDRYSYIQATNELDTKECIKRLNTGLVLNEMLREWRK
ncbi:MAG: ATP-binding protein [Clostridia bacterium]|nr:ATP-binding protein [Clostridia bacterium]